MLAKFTDRFRDMLSNWRLNIGTPVAAIPVLIASVGVTASLLGLREFGKLESLELGAYDQMLRSRPPEKIDSRILVVTVTEQDIQRVGKWPLTDATMAKLLEKLEKYKPRVIGLDIYRDLPVEPGHKKLANLLSKSDRLIAVCKTSDINHPGVAPPKAVPSKRIGFSDLVVDSDGVIRRALLFAMPEKGDCTARVSFSFQLASRYLAAEGIEPYKVEPSGDLGLKKAPQKGISSSPPHSLAVFPRLVPDAGGYQRADAAGYQILLNYRSSEKATQEVTLSQVLNDRVPPEWVRDRVVLIGVQAPSIDDAFYTPFSAARPQDAKMPGVVVHAQIVSQILSAALDKRSIIWYMPWWGEALWICGWAIIGGLGAWKLRHPLWLGLSGLGAIGLLGGVCYGLLIYSAWIPIVAPGLGLIGTGASVVVYAAYQMHKQQQKIAHLTAQQEDTIVLLTTMLKYNTAASSATIPHTQEITLPLPSSATVPVTSLSETSASQPEPFYFSSLLDGRYKIVKVLAQGGFGQTYLAEDIKRPGKPICVVKRLMPARRDDKFLKVAKRLFETEAKILEVLGQHSQIPQLLAYFPEKEEFYLVEEYIEGMALSEELPTDKRLSEYVVVDLLKGILDILAFIHQNQVIHRDIKPSNIIRRKEDEQLVLIDFGAVKQMQPHSGDDTEHQTVAIGTRGYAPPEQLAGHPRPASDIYAVGMIGIQALTGISPHCLPLDRDTGAVIWRSLANVSEQFADILDRMVSYHFSDRYQSAAAVLKDLNSLERSILSRETTNQNATNRSDMATDELDNIPPTKVDSPIPSRFWDATIKLNEENSEV
ncbi:CHASE2 domain-containing protein [Planktothrix sp. FACHB-1375]|uniref:non-specific serine/threonine protein kinase n=1 Tax=Aerosakkonema funiforme FACHB-1375 TaxID=2949571 RepID=A0A926VII7_9CYAN|nr:CHASE2 domain-containing protein [Aerosakkonema funiforme FACHB-1375]